MINPFISIDQQLENIGFQKLYENRTGFIFAKHLGGGVAIKAECCPAANDIPKIRFYDPMLDDSAMLVTEKTLELFTAKMKEWRRQYGRNTKGGRHFSKERS